MKEKEQVDGYHVVEEFLLTKGEDILGGDHKNMLYFKPLIDFGLIIYRQKINATNRGAMKFDLEKFFIRAGVATKQNGYDVAYITVPKDIIERVKLENDKYRNPQNQIEE